MTDRPRVRERPLLADSDRVVSAPVGLRRGVDHRPLGKRQDHDLLEPHDEQQTEQPGDDSSRRQPDRG